MATLIKKALDEYVSANPAKVKRKSDVAPLMSIDPQDLAAFFSGEKVILLPTIKKIADFLSVDISDAVCEHVDNVKKYYEERK